jgi:hypothetical protein
MRSMIIARAPIGAARGIARHVTHVREEAQLSDDHPARINAAPEKLANTEPRQVGYKTVL